MSTKKQLPTISHAGFKSLIQKAMSIGIDVYLYPNYKNFARFTYKGQVIYANDAYVPLQSQLGNFTLNKKITKIILNEHNIPVPRGISAKNKTEAIQLIKKNNLSYPLILKPIDGSLSRGITWNITSQKELKSAIDHFTNERKKYALLKQRKFIVEEMAMGEEYRILVLEDKVISCVKRLPATIIGNGTDSIEKLIKTQNKSRPKDQPIKLDAITKKNIKKNNFTLKSILPDSYKLILRNDVMLGNGGRAIDYTKKINFNIKKQCIKAIKSLGLEYGGIDIITKNITKDTDYVILEINSKPVYTINEKPLVEGKGVDVSLLLLQKMFPTLKQ